MAEDVAVSVGVFWDLGSAGKEGPGAESVLGPCCLGFVCMLHGLSKC